MQTLGLRHLALNVKSAQRSKEFYMNFLGMSCEWEPDLKSVYLTTDSQDNLALHERKDDVDFDLKHQALNHLGFIAKSISDVDAYYEKALQNSVTIVAKPKQHRDGAYSFYMKDPDGYVVQIIFHPPIVNRKA